jgi:putative phosphoesterase
VTRIALISDLHAHLVMLDAVLADIDTLGVDEIICLGDIVDLGPQPNEVIRRLKDRNIASIEGNHDSLEDGSPVPFLQAIEDWTRERLTPETSEWLAALPKTLRRDMDGFDMLAVHGSPRGFENVGPDTSRAELDAMVAGHDFDVLVCGHTHVQLIRRLDERTVVNVGSASMPYAQVFKGGPPRILPWAEYGVVTVADGRLQVELRQVAYDVQAAYQAILDSGMPGQPALDWMVNQGTP